MNTLAGLFQSLGQVNTGATVLDISLTALISVLTGVLIVLFYAFLNRRRSFSVEFSVTIIAICSVIALIIAVIGTNIASAFSLAGIMSIVRFRSLQQRCAESERHLRHFGAGDPLSLQQAWRSAFQLRGWAL